MGKTVMVVDDSATIRKMVGLLLEKEGHEVIEAGDGEDALTKLNGRNIDMFVCDVNMPKMNGLDFLEIVKVRKEYSPYRFSQFIMLTTESGANLKEKGKKLGAKIWIKKPFQPDQFIQAIKMLLV